MFSKKKRTWQENKNIKLNVHTFVSFIFIVFVQQ